MFKEWGKIRNLKKQPGGNGEMQSKIVEIV